MNVEATVAPTRHTNTVGEGTDIFLKDWATGRPIVFSHGSPLNSDAWERPDGVPRGSVESPSRR